MKHLYRFCLSTILFALLSNAANARQGKGNFTDATSLTIIGRPLEVKNVWHRVDTAAFPGLPPNVKKLLTHGAGMAISFVTNSRTVSAKWCVPDKAYNNMTAIAHSGLDLYIKKDGIWQFAGVGRPQKECTEAVVVKNMDSSVKECLLYLPLYNELKSLHIGTDNGSFIKPGGEPFKHRVLIYGSSIVHGASASRPGMAYPARLSRETGIHFINLGVSGSAKMEPAAADMVASFDADAYILDCVPNPSPNQIAERAEYLVTTIREKHPKAPIIVIQSVFRESGNFDQVIAKRVAQQNENIEKEVRKLWQRGIKDLYLIKEDHFLGADHEGSTDGVHPNDLGFDRMLEKIRPKIMRILRPVIRKAGNTR